MKTINCLYRTEEHLLSELQQLDSSEVIKLVGYGAFCITKEVTVEKAIQLVINEITDRDLEYPEDLAADEYWDNCY